ncbi:MAG: two-component regulator propeller domain-containing protein [Nitrospirota bacterium]
MKNRWTAYLAGYCILLALLSGSCYRGTRPSGLEIVAPTPRSGPIVWRHFSTRNDPVKTMTMDGDNLWMGTSKGMIRFNTQPVQDETGNYALEFETYSPRSTGGGITSRGIYVIAVDPNGHKWVGTYGGGLSRYDGAAWKVFTSADGLGDNWIYDIVFDESNTMWVATWSGVSVFDGTRFKTYTVADGLADKWVYSMALDREGIFWFGTEAGVSRFDRKTSQWKTYTHQDGLGADVAPDETTAALFPKGTTPHSSGEGESAYGSSAGRHHMDLEKQNIGPNPNFIISALVDRQDRKWFGTWGGGLTRYDGTTWTTYTKEQGLGGNFILALTLDPDGRIWAGTEGGASWFDGANWHTINAADGLPSDFVFSILFDDLGHRWFGTLNGLSVFRGQLPA